ncbi:hypothetical protein J3R30DRAFT_3399559 [Lentinula aciculospora]|uniref:Transmembrane protein n=1 Tax=Lentinula aciculospora TaxID=153920 RepID=A0A9W9DXX9_9AGAR|nr:hypothetical protein J3R30DRAFT_3399559 [Lentinula aciculospora]
MPDWNSQTEIAKDGVVFSRFMHALLGLYIWEWFTSLQFDWEYIRGKRQFRWPLIFYFLNRYCLLFALMGIAIALNVTTEINCQALYTFNQCVGNAAIGLASINFSLRTMAVWTQKWYIVVPLILLILGQWSLLLHGILLKATYDPVQGCVIVETDSRLLLAGFTYTMCFDFVVLSLTAWKLVINAPRYLEGDGSFQARCPHFGDGLIYFIIAFLSNLLATVFMLLDLNPVMSIIANVPSAIGSTIVACRAVRRLALFTSSSPEMFASTQASTLAFRSNTKSTMRPPRLNTTMKSEGVHVQMETFESPSSGKTYTDPVYDAMGKIIDKSSPAEEYDLEAQDIHNEFKRPPY